MTVVTKKQLIIINTLLSKKGLSAEKAAIIQELTNGRTTSSRDLTCDEARLLISRLNAGSTQNTGADKMKNKILSMAHEMNWKLPGGKIDMAHVNSWTEKYGYLHKKLNAYSYNELPRLVTQFANGPYKDYISSLKKR